MIKVHEVGRKYIMLFMHNNRYNCFTYFVAVNYTACTHSPSSAKYCDIYDVKFMKYFRNISGNIS